MRRLPPTARLVAGGAGVLLLSMIAALIIYGLGQPPKWSTDVWAGGVQAGVGVKLPPFPILTRVDVFDIQVRSGGSHFYMLGSDAGGRDMLALTAQGALPSLGLVAIVVVARLVVGMVAGVAMGSGNRLARTISRGMGRWVVGFPYLALSIIVVQALHPAGRVLAFVVGMAAVGWRDVAEVVAERIQHVRVQPFALAARAVGSEGLGFFRRHVFPFLRPALTVEIPFQASAVIVLLAELGYLQVFLGGATHLFDVGQGGASIVGNVLVNQPELGQLLADSRRYILLRQWEPVLVPALTIALLALAFELIGIALRGRARVGGPT